MAYPDICTKYCKNWKTVKCPSPSLCFATTDKPYFKPKEKQFDTWWEKIKWKHEKKRICKLNHYYCPDCIYHDFKFEGAIFRGNACRLDNYKED